MSEPELSPEVEAALRAATDQTTAKSKQVFVEVLTAYLGFCYADDVNDAALRQQYHLATLEKLAEHQEYLVIGFMYALDQLVCEWRERCGGTVEGIIAAMQDGTFNPDADNWLLKMPPDPFK